VNRNVGALLALIFALSACGGGASFQKEAEGIQSLAAEGALLARDVADGKSTVPFTRVHARELAEKAASLEKKLEATSRLHVWARAARLTGEVATALEDLERAPGDSEAARRVQRKLEDIAKRAEELARP
jgi:hypothetical protein